MVLRLWIDDDNLGFKINIKTFMIHFNVFFLCYEVTLIEIHISNRLSITCWGIFRETQMNTIMEFLYTYLAPCFKPIFTEILVYIY